MSSCNIQPRLQDKLGTTDTQRLESAAFPLQHPTASAGAFAYRQPGSKQAPPALLTPPTSTLMPWKKGIKLLLSASIPPRSMKVEMLPDLANPW